MSDIGVYKSFEVGYLGDRAGVRLDLTTPYTTTQTMPKDKFNRASYDVVTDSHTYSLETLTARIELKSDSAATLDVLTQAQESLKSFIAKNGLTNPLEAADWVEDDIPLTSQSRAPEMV